MEKLLQHGASVSAANRFGQNVLHRLFAVDGKLPLDFYAVTQLLLDVGIHREINWFVRLITLLTTMNGKIMDMMMMITMFDSIQLLGSLF